MFLLRWLRWKKADDPLPENPTDAEIGQFVERLFNDAEATSYQELKRFGRRLRLREQRTRTGFEKRLMHR